MAGSSAVRAGRAFVELFANDNALYRALDKAGARLKSWGTQSAAVGIALAAPLGKAFSDSLTKGADIKKIALQFGEDTGAVSRLAGAFSVAGAGIDEFGSSLEGIKGRIKAAADGNTELVEGLRGLGGRALIGLPVEKQLDTIADRFKDIKLASDQAAVAQDLFGGAGARLLPYLREGAAGLAKLKAEGAKAGEIMSAEDIERSYEASKALNLIWVELKNTVVELGSALLPTRDQTKELTQYIREGFAAARAWIIENRNLVIAAAGAAGGLIALGAGFIGVNFAITTGLGLIGAMGAALGVVLSPIGLLTAGIVGLGAAFVTQTAEGKKLGAELGQTFTSMKQTFSETWAGITNAIKAGDIEGAFKIAGAGIKTIWRELLLTLRKGWNDFVKWMVGIIRDNPALLPIIGAAAGTVIAGPVGALAGLAAGTGANFIDFEKHLSSDLQAAEQGLKAAKDELRAILGARGQGAPAKEPQTEEDRFKSYFGDGGDFDPKEIMSGILDKQKGVFSGPVGQQLGIGSDVAKRQLDAQIGIKNGVDKVAAGVIDLGKNKLVFVGGR